MDANNRFETTRTFLLWRAENAVLLTASLGLLFAHWEEIRWLSFALLFVYIDLIGYLPGAVVYRMRNGTVPPVFYFLYNLTHNYISAAIVALLWGYFVKFEWALLAIPIHLLGDRALFGNSFKNVSVSFEGKPHAGFASFISSLKQAR